VTPAAHPYGIAIDQFVKDVTAASGGRIAIETLPVYANGSDLQLLTDVRGGAVEMGSVSTAVWGNVDVTSFNALQAPFLITRYDLERQVIAGEIGAQMLAGVEKVGLVGLAIHEGGLRKPLGADKALVSLADFQGAKIRSVESPILVAGLRALGADPTPLPIGEVYNALRSGTVNGMEANLGLVQTFKFYEVAKFITANVNLWPFPTALVMNKAAFDDLTPEQQEIIRTAADKVPGFSIDFFEAPSTLVQTLCDEGVKFAVATPEQQAELAEATAPVLEEFSANDPETAGYIEQIQALKDALPAPPAPAPLPEGCAVG
jgi:tripartite ATP-independent transporter DctP family solute receptor